MITNNYGSGITSDRITKIPFNEEMIREAQKWAKDLGSLRNSITKGNRNTAARVAELALAKYWGTTPTDNYNHDLFYKDQRIELKTKRRTVKPKEDYDVSVAESSGHQKPDRYCFVSIEFDRTEGKGSDKKYYDIKNIWYCGDISREDFESKSEYWEKGRVDENNGFTTHENMYNLPISQLESTLIN